MAWGNSHPVGQTKPSQTIARLKRQLKEAGIKQEQVALRAKVTLPHVCNILASRGKSRPVIEAARALLAEVASAHGRDRVEADSAQESAPNIALTAGRAQSAPGRAC